MKSYDANGCCSEENWWTRSRLRYWIDMKGYVLGLNAGGGTHFCNLHKWHRCGRTRWFQRPNYILGWPIQKWECLIKRHHWPYWPEGRPVFMGLCGRCGPWPCCGSIEHGHAPDCPPELRP